MEIVNITNEQIQVKDENGNIINVNINKTKEREFSEHEMKILDNQLSDVAQTLCDEEPFYGYLMMGLIKEFSDTYVDTACVRLSGMSNIMTINPSFWNKLTTRQKVGIVKHELNHIVYFHTLHDRREWPDATSHAIAVDLVVNQYIDRNDLPKEGCFLDDFKLPPDQSCKWYYEKVKEQINDINSNRNKCLCAIQEAINGMLSNNMQGDSVSATDEDGNEITVNINHKDYGRDQDTGETISEIQKDLIKNQLTHVINNAAEAAKSTGRGTLPGHIEEVLEKLNKREPPKFNYHKFIRRFVGQSEKNYLRSTRMRPNLRIDENPGSKLVGMQNVLVGIDVSGSVSTKLLTSLQNDWQWMKMKGYDLDIVQFDTCIRAKTKYRKGMEFKIYGRGGTDFNDIYKEYFENMNKYTCCIVFSDGECCPPDFIKDCLNERILWCFTGGYEDEWYKFPGKVVKIDEKLNK